MQIEYYSQDIAMNIGMVLFFFVFSMLFFIFMVVLASFFKKPRFSRFYPKITILVPVYNESRNIGACLDSILCADYDKKRLEIFCIDDGSTDDTLKIAKRYPVKILRLRHSGKSHALNAGIERASHDFILTIDADAVITRDFIKRIIEPFSDKKVGAANGIVYIHEPKGLLGHFQSVEYAYNNLIRQAFSRVLKNGIWFFGAAACYRKSCLKELGGFRKTLTEDMDISLRIFGQGFDVLTVEADYATNACSSLKGLFKQRMRWFYGGIMNIFRHFRLFFSGSYAIKFLFFNQLFWLLLSLLIFPIIIYQVNFWMPQGTAAIGYLFRWFSVFGPMYVLYKLPEWGLSFLNIFGVGSGIITLVMLLISIVRFKLKIRMEHLLVIVFYFPYTLLLNLILVASLARYAFAKEKYLRH